jgi:hypothetical protein
MDTPRPSAFSRALSKVLFDGRFKAQEMADVAECSDRNIRKVKNQKAALGHDRAERLSRWLCDQDETRPAETFLCAGYAARRRPNGNADGSVNDDVAEILRALGHLKDHEDELHQERGREAIRAIRKELADLEREIEGWE